MDLDKSHNFFPSLDNKHYFQIRKIILEAVILVIVFSAFSFFIPTSLLIDTIIFSIYTLGFDLLYGIMGWLSFGHMLYLGIGAYSCALTLKHVTSDPIIAMLIAVIIGLFMGVPLGMITLRRGGAYFALVNLAFNQLGYFFVLVLFANITGGEDGIWFSYVKYPLINLADRTTFFLFSLLCLVIVFIIIKIIMASNFGLLLKAIKTNEMRVVFLGYNTFNIRLLAFMISSALSAFAGALYAINYAYVTPSLIYPLRSAEVVFASLIGGPGTIFGPIIGSSIFIGLRDLVGLYSERWELITGIALLVIMYRFKLGIWGAIQTMIRRGMK